MSQSPVVAGIFERKGQEGLQGPRVGDEAPNFLVTLSSGEQASRSSDPPRARVLIFIRHLA